MDADYSAKVVVGGTATITIRPDTRRPWIVSQISTELATAPAGSTCALRKNGSLVTSLVAPGDIADGSPAVRVTSSDTLTVIWTGCTVGDVAKAYVIFEYEEPPA